jgi:non-ribosomal peptide synthetase component E (peptide arylation enzyme)
VTRGGAQVEREALLHHLDASGLSRYDMSEFILQLPQLPLTANGKVLKRELVQRVAEGQLRPLPVRYRSQSAARG